MIVVAMLAILAAIAAPRYLGIGDKSGDATLRSQLEFVRGQVEVYRWKEGIDPNLLGDQWSSLVDGQYISGAPVNPLNGHARISSGAGADVGWVWRDRGDGTYELLATDRNTSLLFTE
jgi:type II secretory pathway pseudopilin PulG